jgi:hypothetical protein
MSLLLPMKMAEKIVPDGDPEHRKLNLGLAQEAGFIRLRPVARKFISGRPNKARPATDFAGLVQTTNGGGA